MKKIFTGTILAFFAVAMLNVTKAATVSTESQLPANCIAYNDGCNNCARWTVDGQWACTLMACMDQTTPKYTCTAYAPELTPAACTKEYMPVCGEVVVQCFAAPCPALKETFGNMCMLKSQSNATFLYTWACVTDVPTTEPTACTMQYDPVCADVQVECIQAPCPPIKETFGNSCMMNANKRATFLYKGECKAEEIPAPVACTMEYMPVCGVTQTQSHCEWDVCYPADQVVQTYGNMCTLKADNAKVLYAGECKTGLEAGEWFMYGKVSSVLDQSYLAWKYTPIQAYNYTQTIIDKIDAKLKVSRMQKWAYDKHIQLKRFLETYMKMQNIIQ